MKRIFSNISFGLLALAAPLLSASNARAAATCTTSQGEVTINDTTSCHFETAGGCTAKCTPVNFTATCGGTCSASADATCTDTCTAKCTTACTTTPATFSCKNYCSTDCQAGCMGSCTGGNCAAECSASCDQQCTEKCTVHPGSTDCTTECADSCTGSCTVEANATCDVNCATMLTGGCTTKCSQPSGGLFCDGQFIDISDVSNCNFSFSVNASGQLTGDVKAGCSMAPGPSAPFGLPVGLAAIAGFGLLVVRRRRARSDV